MVKKLKQKFNRQTGFTLIEIVVVCAIIATLASIMVIQTRKYIIRGRDTQRIADLNQIAGALELYYAANHSFPPVGCGYDCDGYYLSYNSAEWNTLATALQPYLGKLPVDPINSACLPSVAGCYSYLYGYVGKNLYKIRYELIGQLETPNHPLSCGVKNYTYYFVSSPLCGPYTTQAFNASPDRN